MNTSTSLLQHPTRTHGPVSLAAGCALAGSLTVAAFFALFLALGPASGQDELQAVQLPATYLEILRAAPAARRLGIGLDNFFIVFYSTLFLMLATLLRTRVARSDLHAVTFGLLGALGVLDLMENMHFLVMVSAAERGVEIGAVQIQVQVWESLVKFHVAYLGLFLLGWIFPRDTWLERALCFALRWVQLPVGMLIYLTPAAFAGPLLLVRTIFFGAALLALFVILRRWQSGSDAPA